MSGIAPLRVLVLQFTYSVNYLSVRNNGWTSDIYQPNKAFVRPFVISPDTLSGGVASGVEFHMSNPHPHTSQCHVNKHSFWSSRMKQPQTATRRTCTTPYSYTYILSNPKCGRSSTHTGAPRVACATKMQQTDTCV